MFDFLCSLTCYNKIEIVPVFRTILPYLDEMFIFHTSWTASLYGISPFCARDSLAVAFAAHSLSDIVFITTYCSKAYRYYKQ